MNASRFLKSRWVMGSALVRRLLWPFSEHGPKPWLSRLAEEQLASVPNAMWEYVGGTSRCIGCGLCDLAGSADEAPSQWIMSLPREPSTASLGLAQAQRLEQMAQGIAKICPARVPARDVARLLADNAKQLAELSPERS